MGSVRQLGARMAIGIALSCYAVAQDKQANAVTELATVLQQAQALAAANRLAEAEATLAKAMSLAPNDYQLVTFLAQVESRLGEPSQAVELFRRVARAQPQSAEAHLNLAIALADTAALNNALRETEVSIRLGPQNARAHLNRARLLADLRRPADARAAFARAERLAPSDSEIDYFWGVFEKENRQAGIAASLFAKVVARDPAHGRAWFLLGQAQQSLGRLQEAIRSWRKAIAIDPGSEEAVYALSQALRSTQPEEAAQLLQRFNLLHAEKQKEERVRELGNQAYSAMQHQEWRSAIDSLQQALDLCATCSLQADLHQRLGLAECHRGDLVRGEAELRLALSLNPNDRETVAALQWVADHKK